MQRSDRRIAPYAHALNALSQLVFMDLLEEVARLDDAFDRLSDY
jgi:hypothetical protein